MGITYTSKIPQFKIEMNRVKNLKIKQGLDMVRNDLIVGLSGSRTGRQYRKPGTQRFYTASSSSELPATVTGQLKRSYRPAIVRDGLGVLGSDLDYAAILESKDSKSSRPHLIVTFLKLTPKLDRLFKEKWTFNIS